MHPEIDLAAAVEGELSPWLASEGFSKLATSRPSVVEYERPDNVVLKLNYYIEDAPPRSIGIALGLSESPGTFRGIGAWELAPDSKYSQLRFSSQDSLHDVLRLLRQDLFPALAPYWRDSAKLLDVIQASERRRQASFDDVEDERRLVAARQAFEAGMFEESIRQYALACGALTPTDNQRLKIARRKAGLA